MIDAADHEPLEANTNPPVHTRMARRQAANAATGKHKWGWSVVPGGDLHGDGYPLQPHLPTQATPMPNLAELLMPLEKLGQNAPKSCTTSHHLAPLATIWHQHGLGQYSGIDARQASWSQNLG